MPRPAAGSDMGHDLARGLLGATTGLAWSWARAVVANSSVRSATACSTVSNNCGLLQNLVGAGRGPLCGDVGPAVARIDDPQTRQRKIAHRPRSHADILAELRLDEDHNGSG